MSQPFTVLQWNILGQLCCEPPSRRQQCLPQDLAWSVRKEKFLKFLVAQKPTIICLQENDQPEFFENELKPLSYHSTFAPRYPGSQEGISILFDTQRFTLIKEWSLLFNEVEVTQSQDGSTQLKFPEMRGLTNRVAKIVLLRERESSNEVFVTTVHLDHRDQFPHVQMNQAKHLISSLENILREWREQNQDTNKQEPALLIVGDFNQEQFEDQYGENCIYKYLTNWTFFRDDNPNIQNPREKEWEINQHWQPLSRPTWSSSSYPGGWKHGLGSLRSAYDNYENTGREPLITCIGWKLRTTLDYIFYSTCLLELVKILPLPVVDPKHFIPNEEHPSDHFPLLAQFSFTKCK
eukprot:TRINITY_DN3970_c0_g4_i2.p1 TRINITY_DN3970_c0_g4~~TRINITY_DN3970_c0_g4_i2.p1  ORF type:complete len:380 (+),score=81.59 TRINITY_DN3970_c0_g4_i2:93-1142(+)